MLYPQSENYVAVEKEKDFYEQSDFQDTCLKENSKMQKSIYGMLPFM